MLNLALTSFADHWKADKSIERSAKVATGLIEEYQLHSPASLKPGESVDLSLLLVNFDLRFLELPASTHGFTVDMGERGIIIAINDKLDAAQTRFVAGHEIGHTALWHPNQLNACIKGQWFYDHLEVEASTVAALLLVPGSAVAEGLFNQEGKSRVETLAHQFVVPSEVILIRRALYAQLGY